MLHAEDDFLNSDFTWHFDKYGLRAWLVFKHWQTIDLKHGFGSATLTVEKLSSLGQVLQVRQVHGAGIFDARQDRDLDLLIKLNQTNQMPEADAIIYNIKESQEKNIFVIKTADCIPLIIRYGKCLALVHAGWRGLANGIISKTMHLMSSGKDNNVDFDILIGPCAGSNSYEVGPEVIEQIGSSVICTKKTNNKFFLDLVATASNQIKLYNSKANIKSTDCCTISNLQFNSHRREPNLSKRNLTFSF